MPTDGQQASANAGTTDRITQLKPPVQLDFDATNWLTIGKDESKN